MIRMYLFLCMALYSVNSWSCYYDFSAYSASCPSSWSTGKGQVVYVMCVDIYGQNHERVGCFDTTAEGYQTAYDICRHAFINLADSKTCPGGDEPFKTRPTFTPDLTANSCGSIIRTDTQVVSEKIHILDVPFDLVYSSDRVEGRKEWYRARIPVTSPSFSGYSSITSEGVTVSVAGQVVNQTFLPSANLIYDYLWDGKDGNGVPVLGSYQATISVYENYNINNIALLPAIGPNQFAVLTSPIYVAPPQHSSNTTSIILGSIFDENSTLGGWDISIRHHYDPVRKTLYLGSGDAFNTQAITQTNGNHWVVSSDRSEIYIFDSSYHHIETKDALTGIRHFLFSYSSGRLIKIKDKYDNETTVQYVGANPVSITSPRGHITQLSTDNNGYIEAVTNPASEVYEMTYTSGGLLLTFEKPSGTISTMTYDQYGLLLLDSSSAGSSTSLDKIFTSNGYTITEQSNLGKSRVHTITHNNGNYLRNTIDANSAYTNYHLDLTSNSVYISGSGKQNYQTQSTTDPRFSSLTMPYYFSITDGANKVTTIDETMNLSNPSDPFSFTTLSRAWTANYKTTTMVYDSTTNGISFTSPLNKLTNISLNSKGDVSSFQYASLGPITFTYDATGRVEEVSQGLNRSTTYTYDSSNGFLSSIENALGQSISFTYDLAGRILTQTLPDLRVINYTYDSSGNLTSITPPGKTPHQMSYNGFDYLASYIPPTVQAPNNNTTTYTYSNDRELTQINRPNGDMIQFNYGTNGNLNSIDLPNGSRTFYYYYGPLSASISEDFFERHPTYTNSKITSEYFTNGDISYVLYYGFNNDLLPSTEILNLNSINYQTDYTYDNDNFLISAGSATYSRSTSTGALEVFSLDDMKQNYSYSTSFGELSSIESKFNSTTTYKEEIVRDNLGRIIQIDEKYGASATDTYDFTYDSAGRLTAVTLNSNPKSNFVYDTNSNRTSQILSGVTTSATFDDQDRMLSFGNKSFTYNMNGELSSVTTLTPNSTRHFGYDVFGNLKSVSLPAKTVNYKVDAHNRRMAKLNGTTVESYFIWNNSNQIVGVTDSSSTMTDRYIYGSKSHVPDYVEKGTDKYQIVTNHLGSPVQVIHSVTGVIAQEIKYDEFGNIMSDTNPGFIIFGFAGCLYDQDTKLCRFGARDYDASIGRWLSKDPILFAGGDTNLYGYVMQDPINYIDPTGKIAWGIILGLGYAFGDFFDMDELNKSPHFDRTDKSYMDRRTDMIIPGKDKYDALQFLKDANEIKPHPEKDPFKNDLRKDLRLHPACG